MIDISWIESRRIYWPAKEIRDGSSFREIMPNTKPIAWNVSVKPVSNPSPMHHWLLAKNLMKNKQPF
jgi:hypothetical protein